MQMTMMTMEEVVAEAARNMIAAVMKTAQKTKALTTYMKAPQLRATGLRFGQHQ